MLNPWPLERSTYKKGDYPKTEFGFYTLPIGGGGDIVCVSPNRKSKFRNWLWKKFKFLAPIETQLACVNKVKGYEVIYIGFDMHLLPIALLKAMHLCQIPVFVLSHFTYNPNYTSKTWKKCLIRIERYFVFKYIDRISFASENLLDLANKAGEKEKQQQFFCNWGATMDFYNKMIYKDTPTCDYFMAAGGMNRDYATLIKAFKSLPSSQLKVFAKYKDYTKGESTPHNVEFLNLMSTYDFVEAHKWLRYFYYNCIAVLLPIDYINDVPNGATVLTEALAMGKPIIITEAKTNYIDVEKEGCGLTVKPHDVAGWVDALSFLLDNPDKAHEMGERSYKLALTKYNDENFINTVYKQMEDMLVDDGE